MLEFLLLNHPLDCPVCDKGGECPLQDLTFRYGPGSTRMRIPKRTLEKPIPISPLIKLDRERCILCYRCTRFSEGVSGDMQLVPENRGAHSIITTFEGRPVHERVLGQRHRAVPRRRAHLDDLPLPGAPVGDAADPERLRPLRRRLQHGRQHPRGPRCARALPQPPRDRRGLAMRQGPLRVRPACERASGSRPASSAAAAASSRWRRTTPSTTSPTACARRSSGSGPARWPSSPRASRPTRRPTPGRGSSTRAWAAGSRCAAPRAARAGRRSRRTRRRSPTSGRPGPSSSPATPTSPTARRWSSSGSERPSRPARGS